MRCASLLTGLALLFPASLARADEFSATRSDDLVERAHVVEISLRQDHAILEVERTVYNGGKRPDQATFHIFQPPEAVAIGLRTQGVADGKPIWFEGELMEAEAAAAKYQELTGIGGYYPKDPALLSWRSQGHLALQVFPCMPAQEKKVAYKLVMPTRYEGGKFVLELPSLGTEEIVPKATVSLAGGRGTLDGEKLPARFELDEPHRLEQSATFFGPVGGRLASVPIDEESTLAGFHLDVSPRLSVVPESARVVVLLDASRSLSEDERSASLSAARAYLGHFSGDRSRAAVLAFSRQVEPLTKGFTAIESARGAIDAASLPFENGSEVSLALKRAGELLSQAPDGAARRVVLFTDLLTKEALTPEVVKKALPKGATLHVVAPSLGSPALDRDDVDPWAAVPRATGGLLWRASATPEADESTRMREVFEELARPLKLDKVSVRAPGLEEEITELVLAEGEGLERHLVSSERMSKVTFEAELWSEPVKKTLVPDAEYGRLRAALVFGSDLYGELDEKQMMALAKHGRAVSPVTSYLAIEPGVRPSTEGLELVGVGEGGGGRGGGIGLSGVGAMGGGAGSPPDYAALLAEALAGAKKTCGVVSAEVSVESTLAEIVEVNVTVRDQDKSEAKRSCLVEQTWRATLPAAFAGVAYRVTATRL
ncbi:MAG: VWA domain-containing protein [Myxococcales bacterium]|nr:VWA domain-containing protein [Myxococcales bacterium]